MDDDDKEAEKEKRKSKRRSERRSRTDKETKKRDKQSITINVPVDPGSAEISPTSNENERTRKKSKSKRDSESQDPESRKRRKSRRKSEDENPEEEKRERKSSKSTRSSRSSRSSKGSRRSIRSSKDYDENDIEKKKEKKKRRSRDSKSTSRRSSGKFKNELGIDFHMISLEELAQRFKVNLDVGISYEDAQNRLKIEGLNTLTPAKKPSMPLKICRHVFDGFSLLLWAGSILCFASTIMVWLESRYFDYEMFWIGFALLFVVAISACFTYAQEAKSSKIMATFIELVPQKSTVLRSGRKSLVPSESLVLGDIVEVKGGDRIPADIRIIKSTNCRVDNSSLTGESEPLSRVPYLTNANPLETKNIAFFSTNCVEGSAIGVVILKGDNTLMGRIANLTSQIGIEETPLGKEIRHFVNLISSVAIFLGIVFFAISLFLGATFMEGVIFLIGVIIANVPESLLATVTVCLTLVAKKLGAKNCHIKNLEAVETLGSTSVICSDKTGTLTQNKMTVAHLWFDGKIFESDPALNADAVPMKTSAGWAFISKGICLCSKADFIGSQEFMDPSRRECIGDPSEIAMLRFAASYMQNLNEIRELYPKVAEIPFTSSNKYSVTIHKKPDATGFLLLMKGAPENIIEKCNTIFAQNLIQSLGRRWLNAFQEAYLELGGIGERVIGFAMLELDYADDFPFNAEEENFPLDGLMFLGLVTMIDPPRASVPEAVSKCQAAGIKVVMVTGDHPITAKAIARSIGIISETSETPEDIAIRRKISVKKIKSSDISARIITGQELQKMSSFDLQFICKENKEIVFARTSPQQKLTIVQAFQMLNNVVAVTGDGVNDSPALKKADIGIAMGITGSDVSKEAADMILMDDNFASIVAGVEEGRLLFDNLKKSIMYVLSSNIPELAPFLMFVLLKIPLFLGTITLLAIDLGTDLFPAISLAHEKSESNIMKKKPRNPLKEKLVSPSLLLMSYAQIGIIEASAAFFAAFVVYGGCGFKPLFLLGIRDKWVSNEVNDLEDSYHQEWTYRQRFLLEISVQTTYLCTVVVCQWANLLKSKTRHNSLYQQGMGNTHLNVSLVIETLIVIVLTYAPGMETIRLHSIKLIWWTYGIPFFFYILFYDEMRKFMIRKYPNSWMNKEMFI